MNTELLTRAYSATAPALNERMRRLLVAMLAQSWGHGGVSAVAAATGVARSTIGRGLRELEQIDAGTELHNRLRRPGAGRKKVTDTDPTLVEDLRKLVDPATRGDPESPLLWVSKSTRKLAEALREQGHSIGHEAVRRLLKDLGFTQQANSKNREGKQHVDRNAQFEHIKAQIEQFFAEGEPVISVDTKKKELVGEFRNGGREWEPKGKPVQVKTHDFGDEKAVPYGVYDLAADDGWVSVGIDHDTSEFAVETIRRWWRAMGSQRYPDARHLMITADGGGSNSSRGRLWKTSLQGLADDLNLNLWVCHFPPSTSKWNKIEHRMFSRITQNWRGRPLVSIEVIVNLIANTRLGSGKRLLAEKDEGKYPKGLEVTQAEFDAVRLFRHEFHGEWNYVVRPKAQCPDWD